MGYIELVGGIPTPLKNMSSSIGIIIPNTWKNKSHVPNHQLENIDELKNSWNWEHQHLQEDHRGWGPDQRSCCAQSNGTYFRQRHRGVQAQISGDKMSKSWGFHGILWWILMGGIWGHDINQIKVIYGFEVWPELGQTTENVIIMWKHIGFWVFQPT